MAMLNGTRVDSRDRGYNLRSGRRIEYASPLVSRVLESPARDVDNDPSLHEAIYYNNLGVAADIISHVYQPFGSHLLLD